MKKLALLDVSGWKFSPDGPISDAVLDATKSVGGVAGSGAQWVLRGHAGQSLAPRVQLLLAGRLGGRSPCPVNPAQGAYVRRPESSTAGPERPPACPQASGRVAELSLQFNMLTPQGAEAAARARSDDSPALLLRGNGRQGSRPASEDVPRGRHASPGPVAAVVASQ